ncbi:MAG: SRPBCC family protein [Saprospiraceae bacterium]|nr:SRPBCC family protein [Saprospiraceae bacterium]HMW40005.1 SRPBCC family protein [Saprospiraceae bacterium]HMX89574.1 SRPBCC family protein [Saprospiraceae bacterium]HMZ41360.1 SRPBCC family protein [Saprospiraceae bacterium]HNA65961.1 SRPBCC family protein [Saprospiraceae bacterium]
MPGTVNLHRVLTASPDKIFRAFSEPAAMASWFPPYGFVCTIDEMNFKEGGLFKMRFTNFTTGNSNPFGGIYLKIVPNEYLQFSDQFDDPNLPGEMITTVTLKKVICGTELIIEQTGIPEMIPVEMCYLGWQESLDKLKRLVEPEIPQP